MTRPFAARDILWLRRQGDAIVRFDIEGDVLDGRSPLGMAVSGLFDPLRGVGLRSTPRDGAGGGPSHRAGAGAGAGAGADGGDANGSGGTDGADVGRGAQPGFSGAATFVLPHDSQRQAGFLQVRLRRPARDGIEADIAAIAPPTEGVPGTALTWQRLIGDACHHLAHAKIPRIYAAVAEADALTIQVFRQCGFQPYANDTVLRLDGAATPTTPKRTDPAASRGCVEERSIHRHAIHGVIARTQPSALTAHEPDAAAWERSSPPGRSGPTPIGRVLLDSVGEVAGAFRILQGRRGIWLRFVCGAGLDPAELLDPAIEIIDRSLGGRRPVYCAVLGHESGLNTALRAAGFEPDRMRVRLVRHLAARRVAPEWAEIPKSVAAAPSPPITRFGPSADSP